jgi:hypothetical protein
MTLSHCEILRKASELGISRSEAARIASNWFGAPPPSKLHEQMAWQSLFINTGTEEAGIFRSEQFLLQQAKLRRIKKRGNRVTDFSGWVFDLCFPRCRRNALALKMGKETEECLLQRHRARRPLRLPELTPQTRDWKIVFRDPLTDVEPFRISALKVDGRALYGVPDIVYRNRKTGEIMIVEIKASEAEVPADGWPNLRAQLWCYAQIDDWRDASKITLVSQVWKPGATTPRKTLIWDNVSRSFQEGCRNMFDAYAKCETRMVKK